MRGVTAGPDNNANLLLGAGMRFAGARLTSYSTATGLVVDSRVQRSNIVDNAYGAINVAADGVTATSACDPRHAHRLSRRATARS